MYTNYNYPGYAINGYQLSQPQFNAYNTPPSQAQTGLKGRPVSSLEEARATNIDFDGSLFVFPDIVNKKIYTKQINSDGTATFNTYGLVQEPVEVTPTYVTKEEFESTISNLKEILKSNKKEIMNF